MDPLIGSGLLSLGQGVLGGLFGGGGQQEASQGKFTLVNPGGYQLLNRMIRDMMMGQGEFGLGASLRQALPTYEATLASRGVSPESGVARQGYQDIIGQASAIDAANRFQRALGLATASPALASGEYGGKFSWRNPFTGTGEEPEWLRPTNRMTGTASRSDLRSTNPWVRSFFKLQ